MRMHIYSFESKHEKLEWQSKTKRSTVMQTLSNQDWIFNIENIAGEACRNATPEHVRDVFVLYGATSADDLDPSSYEAVFSELQLLAYDF